MQTYSDPSRADSPTSLPDVEVFEVDNFTALQYPAPTDGRSAFDAGWYWWSCFPGCLPDGEPNGPFETEALAEADAQEGVD